MNNTQVLNALKNLTGVLLLNVDGEAYVIGDYIFETSSAKFGWFFRKDVIYVTHFINAHEKQKLDERVEIQVLLKQIVADRKRFIKLGQTLKRYRCSVVSFDGKKSIKNQSNNTDEFNKQD